MFQEAMKVGVPGGSRKVSVPGGSRKVVFQEVVGKLCSRRQ